MPIKDFKFINTGFYHYLERLTESKGRGWVTPVLITPENFTSHIIHTYREQEAEIVHNLQMEDG